MRSLLLAWAYPPVVGGAEKLLFDLAEALAPRGIRVLAGSYEPDREAEHDEKLPYLVKRVKMEPDTLTDRLTIKLQSFSTGRTTAFYEHCKRKSLPVALDIVKEFDPGIVICGWGYMLGATVALKASNRIAAAVAHGDDVVESKGHERLEAWWRQLDRIITNSDYTRDNLLEMGVDDSRVVTVPPGIDPSISEEPRIEPDFKALGLENSVVILTVCRLVPHKGTDTLIDAMPNILAEVPNAVLVVVGDGPYRADLEARACKSPSRDHIRFTGRIDEEHKNGWYQTCAVFSMPSRHDSKTGLMEGFGYTFLEANAFGKPVVGGRSGGIPDAVDDGVTGFLVNPLDVSEVAEAIIRIIKTPGLARQMGENGRKWVENDRNKTQFLSKAVDKLLEET